MTYREAWDLAFKGYSFKKEPNRLRRIFSSNSEYNQRLNKYCEICDKHSPDFDKELFKLGFTEKEIGAFPYYLTYDKELYLYFNDKGDCIKVFDTGTMKIDFNGTEKSFSSQIVGEKQRQALSWIKDKMEECG